MALMVHPLRAKEFLTHLFQFLEPSFVCQSRRVCKAWRAAAEPYVKDLLALGQWHKYKRVFAAGPERSITLPQEASVKKTRRKIPLDGMHLSTEPYRIEYVFFPIGSMEEKWRIDLLEPLPDELLRNQSKLKKNNFPFLSMFHSDSDKCGCAILGNR